MRVATKLTTASSSVLLVAIFIIGLGLIPVHVSAQAGTVHTGVVIEVETDDNAALVALSIVAGDGTVHRISVSQSNPNTQYGLENRVGDRWVSDHASKPQEAAVRLHDQQQRLAQIAVQVDGNGVATSVVQAESTDVDPNLGYLFAVVAIAFICIAAYLVYLGLRQRSVAADIARLKGVRQDDDS